MTQEQIQMAIEHLQRFSVYLNLSVELNPLQWFLFRFYSPVIYNGYLHVCFRVLFLSVTFDVHYPTSKQPVQALDDMEEVEL